MPIDVEADLVERTTVEMPSVLIIDMEAEASERTIVALPVLIVEEVEFP